MMSLAPGYTLFPYTTLFRSVVATVVQNPYEYGYQSIKILDSLHKGDKSAVPAGKFVDIPARVIDKANVDAFRSEEHTSELQSRRELVCRLLLEKNKNHNEHH